MTEFQRNLNAIVIHNSKTDLGSNSNSNLLIFKVIVIYYTDLGSNSNSNRQCIVIDPISDSIQPPDLDVRHSFFITLQMQLITKDII